MHDEMKYIVLNSGEALIFPKTVAHRDVFQGVRRSVMFGQDYKTVESAGFVRFTELGHAICWGESETLRARSNPVKDQGIIDRQTVGYAEPSTHARDQVVSALADWLGDADIDNAIALGTIKKLLRAGRVTLDQLLETNAQSQD